MTETITSAIVAGEPGCATAAADALRGCGVRVVGLFEDDGGIERGLALGPDLAVVSVAHGAEMWAYRIGHEAAAAGVAAIFVVAAAGTPAVESLVHAVPGSLAITLPLSPTEMSAKVAEALAARGTDRRAIRP